jgi:ribosomal protein S18 acetylase RimI-like enzyme
MNPSAHTLDHPIGSALAARHKHFRQGGPLACRYHPDVAPFAELSPPGQAAYEALHQLLRPGEEAALLSFDDTLDPTPALLAVPSGVVHQMVDTRGFDGPVDATGVLRLGPADAEDMLQLATLTKPGPFGKRTHETGNYIGIREQGQLIAMAGERMRPEGHVEISAVCVRDEHRGKGLAARLMNILRKEIVQRGDVPFLHVFADNHAAIALYQRLGFAQRQVFHLIRIRLSEASRAQAVE